MKKLRISTLLSVLLFSACNSNNSSTDMSTAEKWQPNKAELSISTEKEKSNSIMQLPNDYPEHYKKAGLPMWKNVVIERSNEIQHSTNDPRYQVILSSKEDIHTIANYYNNAMKDIGWKPSMMALEGQREDKRTLSFQKDKQQILINILAIPQQEKRIITIMFPHKLG